MFFNCKFTARWPLSSLPGCSADVCKTHPSAALFAASGFSPPAAQPNTVDVTEEDLQVLVRIEAPMARYSSVLTRPSLLPYLSKHFVAYFSALPLMHHSIFIIMIPIVLDVSRLLFKMLLLQCYSCCSNDDSHCCCCCCQQATNAAAAAAATVNFCFLLLLIIKLTLK